jgi:hypothetical protein
MALDDDAIVMAGDQGEVGSRGLDGPSTRMDYALARGTIRLGLPWARRARRAGEFGLP